MLNRSYTRKKIGIIIFSSIFILAFVYGMFKVFPLLIGPTITIYNPKDGDNVASTTFEISGKVMRAKKITLNGRPITIDTSGYFTERLVGSLPYTIIILIATDRYGSKDTKILNVIPNL
jgi:hypothetical protein